jgi:hypothetical protein
MERKMIMKKFKMTKFEMLGKEYEVKDVQDVIPSMVDTSEIKGGVGNPFLFNKNKIIKIEEVIHNNEKDIFKIVTNLEKD